MSSNTTTKNILSEILPKPSQQIIANRFDHDHAFESNLAGCSGSCSGNCRGACKG